MVRNIGYAFWLCFNVLLVFATVQLFDTPEKIRKLCQVYLFSFFAMSLFGLVQFAIPLIGGPGIYVEQWFIQDKVARVNGFSYEPSYYATYLLTGWCLHMYLIEVKHSWFNQKFLKTSLFFITIGMVLSTSRMGWLFLVVWFLRFPLMILINFVRGELKKIHLYYLLGVSGLIASLVLFVYAFIGFDNLEIIFAGLGIMDTSAHSSATRWEGMLDTLEVFLKSPLIGYGLGGISYAIGNLNGIKVDSLELAKLYEGVCIYAEVLAASGFVGFLFFIYYQFVLIYRPLKLALQTRSQDFKYLLKGLMYSFLFLLAILQLNQNILRPYFWMHVAIISAAYYCTKQLEWQKQKTIQEVHVEPVNLSSTTEKIFT